MEAYKNVLCSLLTFLNSFDLIALKKYYFPGNDIKQEIVYKIIVSAKLF